MASEDAVRSHQLDVLNRAFDELSKAFYAANDDASKSVANADERLEMLTQRALDDRTPHFNRTLADAIRSRSLDHTAVLQLMSHHAREFGVRTQDVNPLIEARNALHHRRMDPDTGREFVADPVWGRRVIDAILSVVSPLEVPRSESQILRYREFLSGEEPRSTRIAESAKRDRSLKKTESNSGLVSLDSEQQECIRRVLAWCRDEHGSRFIAVSGEAGSGKTTVLARLLLDLLAEGLQPAHLAIVTPTTKAREVLREKLPARDGLRKRMNTLASMVWRFARPTEDGEDLVFTRMGEKKSDQVRGFESVSLVLVDEASMVTRREHESLTRRYRVVYFGDADQLPPVIEEAGGNGQPEDQPADILEKPDIRLNKVHRQAEESPILQAAARVRAGEQLEFFEWTDDRVSILREDFHEVDESAFHELVASHDVVLSGRNIARFRLNTLARELRGHSRFPGDSQPKPGEILICTHSMRDALQGKGVNNGERLIVEDYVGDIQARPDRPDILDHRLEVRVESDPARSGPIVVSSQYLRGDQIRGRAVVTRDISGPVSRVLRVDWGYALTVHKAQGSEWPSVLVVDDLDHDDRVPRQRWNYVAYTRAMERLTVVKLARESRLV